MGLIQLLKEEIKNRMFRPENEITILERYEGMVKGKYCTSARDDILRYSCFEEEAIKQTAEKRRRVKSYLNMVLPGFDSRDAYLTAFLQICDGLSVGNLDLVINELLDSKEFDVLPVYEKKGHYFLTYDGKGLDITSFIEEHFKEIIGIRDKVNSKGYRPYILFFEKLGGQKNGK